MTVDATCPSCQGKCCRNLDLGYMVQHMGASFYEHECTSCVEGVVPPLEDRSSIVAFLRRAAKRPHPVEAGEYALSWFGRQLLDLMADQIENHADRKPDL